MQSAPEILRFLDQAHEEGALADFGNINVDYVSSRMSVYRDAADWIVAFNSIVWRPSSGGLYTMLELVGTGVLGRQGSDTGRGVDSGDVETTDDDRNIISIRVRGEEVDPASLAIHPDYRVQPELGFWVCIALLDRYREQLLASPAEVATFVPAEYRELLTVDEWHHPIDRMRPSETDTFPRIATILATGDPSHWRPSRNPNTHWSLWYPK